MKCNYCEENLVEIIISHGTSVFDTSVILLSKPDNERAVFYACTSRDCKNCGNVIIIPMESKDN